jgi:Zn-dependent protease with chaperone function
MRRRQSANNPYTSSRYTNNNNRKQQLLPSATVWLPILGHRLGIRNKKHHELLLLAIIASILALWFLTPLSDYCASCILWTVPVQTDIELGRQAVLSLERMYPRVEDRWGVHKIGLELVKAGRNAHYDTNNNYFHYSIFHNVDEYQWDFGVVHAPNLVNAFALPGGIIRVTDALLQNLYLSNGEIAALLGHEMGHVLYRHSQQRAIKQRLIATLWDAFVYEDNDEYAESFGEAVAEGLWKSASYLGNLAFSRKQEYQADGAAWDLLSATYLDNRYILRRYHPNSMMKLLTKLWDYQGRDAGTATAGWESTHPGTKERIDALKEKWNKLDRKQKRRFV